MIKYDPLIEQIADYVLSKPSFSSVAIQTSCYALLDSMGCAMAALKDPDCVRLLGSFFQNYPLQKGLTVPGSSQLLDPIQATFHLTSLIRWLDYNDTWLAAEWGHPSDNIGAILACHYHQALIHNQKVLMGDVLNDVIKAYEIQGVLALENAFNQRGLDHVILVKIATASVCSRILGGTHASICAAISHAFLDGHALRTYRHAPNTGSRKSWAAADAAQRGFFLAQLSTQGEMGYPTVLSTPKWGFNDIYQFNQGLQVRRPFEDYIMKHILFKVRYPAEFHAQTALECAIDLHRLTSQPFDHIKRIVIETQQPAIDIIHKKGPLHNPADRDHCLEYIVAIGLIYGTLQSTHYYDETAKNPVIDQLRSRMVAREQANFTKDYMDPQKRSIANAIQLFFIDGTESEKITYEYPIGHVKRREEGIPFLKEKFLNNCQALPSQIHPQLRLCFDQSDQLMQMDLRGFLGLFCS